NPPAIGIDFFQGPYQDYDGIDNPGPTEDNGYYISYQDAISQNGIVYEGTGIGYGDDFPDNERYGMRAFFYFNNAVGGGSAGMHDPVDAGEFYNYMTGYWADGTPVTTSGSGYNLGGGGVTTNYC